MSFSEATWTHLDIPVEADRGHEDTLQVLKGHWPMLLLVDEEGEGVLVQVQENAYCGALTDAPLSSVENTHTVFHSTRTTC